MLKHLPNPNQGRRAGKTRRAASLRVILLGLMVPLLLTATAFGQCGWPAPVKKALVPIRFDQRAVPDSPGPSPSAAKARGDLGEPSDRHPSTPNSPLPPASAFTLQTNLRQYLETWPTPGTKVTDDCPEYVGESDSELH
jgi:hypothetical protein